MGFFVGVFLDAIPMSFVGIFFGVASSVITALHSVVIKQSLNVVDGSALLLSWYTNFLSSFIFLPLSLLAGEGPSVISLLFGAEDLPAGKNMSAFQTYMWGSLITVSCLTPSSLHCI